MNRRTVLKGGIVLAATAHTAIANDRDPEGIGGRLERLSTELSAALEEWQAGSFMGMIFPSSDPRSISFRQIGATPRQRFRRAVEDMQRAHSLLDPTVTHWQTVESIDDDLRCRIMLSGWSGKP